MIKATDRPDQRYGVTLASGVSKMGARQNIIKTASEVAKKGIAVGEWTVLGKEKIARQHRAELIHSAYRRQWPLSLLKKRIWPNLSV